MRDSDESLLKSFALNRDEAAFRTLAERYLGLVFHTALRRTNNRPLAEEVSQNILCALAKKASSLAKKPDLLPAWLHRATLFESSKAMRSESSYQRRKQLQASGDSAGTCSNWIEALPHLDQALDKLPEPDRHVLLQHFFDSHPFPKIAQALGKSTAAVQKQSQRALEKLSRILRSKGITLSATVLATGLTSELAKAAPASLLKTATTAVLTGTATYSTTGLTLMTLSKSKALIPLALVLCALPLALQQMAISHARTSIGQLQTGPAPRVASDSRNLNVSIRSEPDNLAAWKDLAMRVTLQGEMSGSLLDKRIELELRDRLEAMSVEQILEKRTRWPTGTCLRIAMGCKPPF
jgi:RNA polymerase sigma factor (sigma-70 family)